MANTRSSGKKKRAAHKQDRLRAAVAALAPTPRGNGGGKRKGKVSKDFDVKGF